MSPTRQIWPILALLVVLNTSCAYPSKVLFSPNGGIRSQIIDRINYSKSAIDVAMYSFTSEDIAQAIVNALNRGVRIRVIMDLEQSSNSHNEFNFLNNSGIPVRLLSGVGLGIMHDKFAVFDGKELLTGSYNWTTNAERHNHEDVIFLKDKKVIAGFEQEFERLWVEAKANPRG
jgi:phospholipase D